MLLFAAGFLLGNVAVQCVPALPTGPWIVVLAIAAAIAAIVRRYPLAAIFLGASWTLYSARSQMNDELPARLEGSEVEIIGVVASIPVITPYGLRFLVDTHDAVPGIPDRVELSWFNPSAIVAPGETWRWRAKLRRPRGFANPGGFDYERELASQRIGATGYVREGAENHRLAPPSWRYTVLRARASISARLTQVVAPSSMSGLMRGLAVGDQQAISGAAWRVFANTGTTHLVAISGFHIGAVAGFIGYLCGGLARLRQAQQWRLTRPDARAIGTIAGALAYSALAGLSVPTQRTLVMLCAYLSSRLLRRVVSPWHSLAFSLVCVLTIDPLATLTVGLWLSFGAVSLILFAIDGRLALASILREHLRMQAMVSVGLMPVLIAAFGNVSLIAPWVNLFAIPFFSGVAVPGVLLGVAFLYLYAPLGAAVLQATARLLEWSWPVLVKCAELPLAMWYFPERPAWTLLLALSGAVLWAARTTAATRVAAAALCVPVLAWPVQVPLRGGFELATLDVGQGLALVVRTRAHTLVYDTGPSFRSGRDTGELVVLPYLRTRGVRRVDMLVLSHGDLDHVGGMHSILSGIPVERVLKGPSVSVSERVAQTCAAGETWRWDDVDFSVLHPIDPHDHTRNNSSCVIEVRGVDGSALLMGDAERESELSLVERGRIAKVDIVVAAHHGSRTSSTAPFVAAARPRYVLFSAGWQNRWGFPKADVVERWQQQGATTYTTSRSGAIEITVAEAGTGPVREYRLEHPRYWRQ